MSISTKSTLLVLFIIQLSISGSACSLQADNRQTKKADSQELSQDSIKHEGLLRRYYFYVPETYTAKKKHALIFVLHGGGTKRGADDPSRKPGEGMWKLLGKSFDAIADKEAIIVVYPEGIRTRWNDGSAENKEITNDADDIGFISALIDTFSKQYTIDRERIYVTGFSNGAAMTLTVACRLSDRIAAVAPVDGELRDTKCSPRRPVPVLMIHGKDYPQIMKRIHQRTGFDVEKEVSETLKFWREFNSCEKSPKVTKLPDVDQDGTAVTKTVFGKCKNDAEVVLYSIEGGGHTWPGGVQYLPKFLIGKTSHDINASEVIWGFFKEHPLSASAK